MSRTSAPSSSGLILPNFRTRRWISSVKPGLMPVAATPSVSTASRPERGQLHTEKPGPQRRNLGPVTSIGAMSAEEAVTGGKLNGLLLPTRRVRHSAQYRLAEAVGALRQRGGRR